MKNFLHTAARLGVTAATLAVTGALALTTPLNAQVGARTPGDPEYDASNGRVRLTPGAQYNDAGPIWRFLFGDNWRDVWAKEIEVPVLDLSKYAGGLTPTKSGGNQTRTLHLKGADGRHYVFRSVPKSVQRSLGPDIQGTTLGDLIQDQNSSNHPSSATIADVVQDATGVLHPSPRLYVMPDDPRLGEFRAEYGNMLGHIEIKPDDVPEGVEQFAHADKIQDADKVLDNLEASTEYRFDARSYLKTRLVDAIMGDFDRGADQWDFARIDKDGVKTYSPIARDRDWAFMRSNGFVMKQVRHVYAKIGSYDPQNENLTSITFMTHEFDRSHLVALPRATWDSVVAEIQTSLSDQAVEAALRAQPEPFAALSAERIRSGLKARREGLPELARKFYDMVNEDADVFAADENERADIVRNDDGSLTVRIDRLDKDGNPNTKEGPAFLRTFFPSETKEVRVYMQEGNDIVTVRGDGPASIKVRVVGGAGDDVITDATTISGGHSNEFYDATGANRITAGRSTTVHTRPFVTTQPTTLDPEPKEKPRQRSVQEERRGHFQDQWRIEGADFTTQHTQSIATRFWGAVTNISPVADLRDGSGVILGGGVRHTEYGFRSQPYAARVSSHLMYATSAQRFGLDFMGDWHPMRREFALTLYGLASGFEAQRFYGYGNATPLVREDDALVLRNELRIEPGIHWGGESNSQLTIGPVLRLVDPRIAAGTPAAALAADGGPGTDSFGSLGMQATAKYKDVDHGSFPHRGYSTKLTMLAAQAIQNGDGVFARAAGELIGYIPLSGPTLAIRVGGERVFGEFPIHEAALLGGRTTVRGYRWQRFAGDAMAFGNAEIRAKVTRAEILARGDVGVIALADVGRAWMDGVSSGGWHHALGGGVSFTALSKSVSVVFAHGEENRVYLNLGLPF